MAAHHREVQKIKSLANNWDVDKLKLGKKARQWQTVFTNVLHNTGIDPRLMIANQ